MTDTIAEKPSQPRFKKGFIVALFLGVAMVYFVYVISMFRGGFHINYLRYLAEIAAVVAAIVFLNKNYKISLILFAAYLALLLINHHPMELLSPFFRGGRFDSKYAGDYYLYHIYHFRAVEFILAGLTLYGLNKANKIISIIASSLLLVSNAFWLFSSHISIPTSSAYGAAFLFTACYGELLLPLALFLCAIKPRWIHGCIKFMDGYLAVRLLLFIAADLLYAMESSYFSHFTHINLLYLINVSWMPLMSIFGLNAVLLFPIRFKELAKIFGWSVLIVGVIFAASAAQQSADDNKNSDSKADREDFLNELRANIQSWEDAGFSGNFSREALFNMLSEGRITQKEYEWLIREVAART